MSVMQFGDIATWFGAVGTLGAVGVALYQSRQAQKAAVGARADAEATRLAAGQQLLDQQRAADERLEKELAAAEERLVAERRMIARAEEARQREAERIRQIDLCIQLLEAWDAYRSTNLDSDTKGRHAARARSLISALPGTFARIAAKDLDVPRTPYRDNDYQPIHTLYWPPDREALAGQEARIEIEFNLQQLARTGAHGSLREALHDYIERRENPQNEDVLTAEDQAGIDAQLREQVANAIDYQPD